jgi:hypothetical protein
MQPTSNTHSQVHNNTTSQPPFSIITPPARNQETDPSTHSEVLIDVPSPPISTEVGNANGGAELINRVKTDIQIFGCTNRIVGLVAAIIILSLEAAPSNIAVNTARIFSCAVFVTTVIYQIPIRLIFSRFPKDPT